MDINKIRVKYTLALCSIAFFFIILVSMNYLLVAKTEQGLAYFGSNFNPAISAVINADRDLYQAKVAELNVLQSSPSNQKIAAFYAEYEENAKQAYDRMLLYKKLMAMYPENIRQLNRFDSAFKAWKQESDKVFALVRSNDLAGAKLQSDGASDAAFNELREFYNIAGEIADKTSSEVSEQTISSVVRSQVILTVISTVIVALTLFTGIAAPKAMADALENLSSKLKELNSGDGDLTKRIHTNRKDEIGQVANDFDELINGIAELIRSIVE